ncbi:hypothetical protein TUM17377_10570 [Shewanella chilikensis]|nr:hypothetical protein TUM17377_10570 [Shewanella chilikensis]
MTLGIVPSLFSQRYIDGKDEAHRQVTCFTDYIRKRVFKILCHVKNHSAM